MPGTRSNHAPWITPYLKRLMCERDRLKKISVTSNHEIAWSNFRLAINQFNHQITETKSKNYTSYFNANFADSKETWKCINSLV